MKVKEFKEEMEVIYIIMINMVKKVNKGAKMDTVKDNCKGMEEDSKEKFLVNIGKH